MPGGPDVNTQSHTAALLAVINIFSSLKQTFHFFTHQLGFYLEIHVNWPQFMAPVHA